MKRALLISLLFITLSMVFSVNAKEAAGKPDDNPGSQDVVKTVKADSDFASVKEYVELAITGRGLLVSGTLHISEMLNRTGKDVGFEKPVFKMAEAVEFCSALISHKMAAVDPANVSICPFTVSIYELTDKPGEVFVSYRQPRLQGDGAEVEKEIMQLLDGIVSEALE